MATDACDYGVGSVLMQKEIDTGRLLPVAFYSRKLKYKDPDETKYSVTDKEALAVINSLNHFKYLVLGHEIVVLTDHKPLIDLFNHNVGLSPKRTRYLLILQDFGILKIIKND